MMNIMNIEELIGVLTGEDAATVKTALETIVTIIEKQDTKEAWKPAEGEEYFYMWGTGKGDSGVFGEHREKDLMRLAVGNYFKTPEERDYAVEYLKIVAELKAYAYEHNDTINWDVHQERKYKLCWNREKECVDTTWSRRKITDGIYFSSHEVAMEAVAEVGEDRIKKYYLPM